MRRSATTSSSVVADEQRADLYVFASNGVAGGATARVRLRLTEEKPTGDSSRSGCHGSVYLTRTPSGWKIFGYDLHRTVVPCMSVSAIALPRATSVRRLADVRRAAGRCSASLVPDAGQPEARFGLVKVDGVHGVDAADDVTWILALGSDARPGQPVLGSRSDAIQLVGINAKTGHWRHDRHPA